MCILKMHSEMKHGNISTFALWNWHEANESWWMDSVICAKIHAVLVMITTLAMFLFKAWEFIELHIQLLYFNASNCLNCFV